MENYYRLLFALVFFTSTIKSYYVDTLDHIIDENKTVLLGKNFSFQDSFLERLYDGSSYESLVSIYELIDDKSTESFFSQDESFDDLEFEKFKIALLSKLYLSFLQVAQREMLSHALLNYESLDYWNYEDFCDNQSWYNKTILHWGSSSLYKKNIEKNIQKIDQVSYTTHSCLGLVEHVQKVLSQVTTQQEFCDNVQIVMQLQGDIVVWQDVATSHDFFVIIKESIKRMIVEDDFIRSFSEHQSPTYLERNWKFCLGAMAVTCAAAYTCHMYQDQIKDGLNFCCDNYIKQPIEKNKEALQGIGKVPHLDTKEIEDLLRASELVEMGKPEAIGEGVGSLSAAIQQLDNFTDGQAGKVASSLYPSNWLPSWFYSGTESIVEEGLRSPQESSTQELSPADMSAAIMNKDKIILSNPDKNFVPTLSASIRLVLRIILNGENQLNIALKEVYADNRLMISLAALIPAMAVAGTGIFAAKNLYKSYAYEPIRQSMRHLDRVLNNALEKDFSFDIQGQVYFLTEQLKNKVSVLPMPESFMLHQDITELRSLELNYAQKYNILQRMYRTYKFLLPV